MEPQSVNISTDRIGKNSIVGICIMDGPKDNDLILKTGGLMKMMNFLFMIVVVIITSSCCTHFIENNGIRVHCIGSTVTVKGYNQTKADGDYIEFLSSFTDEQCAKVRSTVFVELGVDDIIREHGFTVQRTDGEKSYGILYFQSVTINNVKYDISELVTFNGDALIPTTELPFTFEVLLDSIHSQVPNAMMRFNDDKEHFVVGINHHEMFESGPSIVIL